MRTPPAASPWRWRLAALAAVFLLLVLVARFWHPVYGFTVFYQLDALNDDTKIAAFRELPVFVHRDTGSYDGLYYAQLAHDPSLRDPQLARAMDDLPYRARRILAPALAWLLGLGQPRWIIHAYSLLNVAAWLALAAVLWRLLAVRDARGWCAWAGVLFSAGTLSSVRLALTDNLSLLLIASAVYAAERWRGGVAVVLVSGAALARETALLAVAGLCKSPWFSGKNFARVALAALPLAAWLGYVRWQVGGGSQGWGNFSVPASGFVGKWRDTVVALTAIDDKPLAWTTLLATLAITVQGFFIVLRPHPAERWWRLGATYAGLMLLLGTAVWEGFPGAATRVLLPLHLAFNVLVHRIRASVVWLVLGNLSVLSGLLMMRDIPRVPNELIAQDLGGTVAVVRFESDWYGREEDRRHVWLWTEQRGTLSLDTIPSATGPMRLEFALRSLNQRRVALRVEGREVWRGQIGPQLARHSVDLPPTLPRHAQLVFETDTPATPESSAPGARALAFALYNPRLALTEP